MKKRQILEIYEMSIQRMLVVMSEVVRSICQMLEAETTIGREILKMLRLKRQLLEKRSIDKCREFRKPFAALLYICRGELRGVAQ